MRTLAQIREAKALKVAEARALADTATREQRAMSPDDTAKFDKIKAEIEALEAEEARAQFLTDQERRGSAPVIVARGSDTHDALESRVSVLRVLQAKSEGRNLDGAEAEYQHEAERRHGRKSEGVFVPMRALQTRATDTAKAGELIQTDVLGGQFIDPLRNKMMARRLGARVLSGLRGPVTIPRYGTGVGSGWFAEGGAIPEGDYNPDNVTLSPKFAGGLTEMSKSLIMQSSPDVERLIADDLSATLALAIDKAMIGGAGANAPAGILDNAGVQVGTLAGMTWAQVVAMKALALGANVDKESLAWLFNAQVGSKFEAAPKVAGMPEFLLEDGKIADIAAYNTEQVANTTGATPKGRAILGSFDQVLLGIWSDFELLVNPYADAAYRRGGVLVRAISVCDVAIRQPKAFVVASDIVVP